MESNKKKRKKEEEEYVVDLTMSSQVSTESETETDEELFAVLQGQVKDDKVVLFSLVSSCSLIPNPNPDPNSDPDPIFKLILAKCLELFKANKQMERKQVFLLQDVDVLQFENDRMKKICGQQGYLIGKQTQYSCLYCLS